MRASRLLKEGFMGRLTGSARRDEKRAPMQLLAAAVVSKHSGVDKDFRGKPGRRQVTVISAEAWCAVCQELGRELPWTTRRANLLVDDIDLPRRAGDVLQIGQLRLQINGETDPCSRMDEQCAGLKQALTPDWRGGVFCTVIEDGAVAIGDAVILHRIAE
jgi:MOSC domain-containing protein YiiM